MSKFWIDPVASTALLVPAWAGPKAAQVAASAAIQAMD
jgi:hypothetical protein